MATIVLVHGAWLNAWCWNKVAPMLESDGHRIYAPDLAGHGSDQRSPGQITLDTYTQHIGRLLELLPGPAVLVGHSMAGIIISEVAERWPEKVKHLVYVAGFLLTNGQSLFDIAKTDTESLLGPALRPNEAESSILVDHDAMAEIFFADCNESDTRTAIDLSRPEPLKPFMTPISITDQGFGSVPRSYIHTANDKAVSSSVQHAMVAASPCIKTVTVDTGHSPFMAKPDAFVNAVLSLPL